MQAHGIHYPRFTRFGGAFTGKTLRKLQTMDTVKVKEEGDYQDEANARFHCDWRCTGRHNGTLFLSAPITRYFHAGCKGAQFLCL